MFHKNLFSKKLIVSFAIIAELSGEYQMWNKNITMKYKV